MSACQHLMMTETVPGSLVQGAVNFMQPPLQMGGSCICVATEGNLTAIKLELRAHRHERSQLITLDANELLDTLMQRGKIERLRFHDHVGLLVSQVAAHGLPVSIYGEMAGMLAARGETEVAWQLEEYWNELSRLVSFSLLCGYPRTDSISPAARDRLALAHTHHIM